MVKRRTHIFALLAQEAKNEVMVGAREEGTT